MKHLPNISSTFVTPLLLLLVTMFIGVQGQCPWQREIPDLQPSCICAYNLGQELSVQCDQVEFPTLLEALNVYAHNKSIDLLYINNSSIKVLQDNTFINLSLHNVQLSSCQISKIGDRAFRGQENTLKNLNLQDNLLTEVPVKAIQILSKLNLLDLSKNRIAIIRSEAFKGLNKLSTLKINDNNVTLTEDAFRGLEHSLKNLNLKGTRQRRIPEAIRGLRHLAFLDLSLNGIKELPGAGGIRTFENLDSLTALNLERNLIQNLGETSFVGVRKTLSSLSLLNNLLAEFPVGAIHALKELRVLDIGFNLLTSLPETAFRGNPSITLLALDGNPLSTVPEKAFAHLNVTLRGLSLGGRFLHCDCKLRWVAEWIRNGDLQVTSRERNPQFCGSPVQFRDRGFYSIQPDELNCSPESINNNNNNNNSNNNEFTENGLPTLPKSNTNTTTTNSSNKLKNPLLQDQQKINSLTTTVIPVISNSSSGGGGHEGQSTTSSSVANHSTPNNKATTTSSSANKNNKVQNGSSETILNSTPMTISNQSDVLPSSGAGYASPTSITATNNVKQSPSLPTWRQGSSSNVGPAHKSHRPPLVLGSYPPPGQRGGGSSTRIDDSNEVQVKNAFRQDNSVIIQWDSDTANILGFRVVYRLFGEKSFKQGPPLESSEREFKIKNVPAQECIIVCVISLEELHVTPETVPYQQCREVRTVSSPASNMDKITIAASAAICGTIIVAVIVFIAASRRSRKLQTAPQKGPLPIGGLPVNCCGPTSSPGPLGSIATLSAFHNHKEWDQVSAYSGRSMTRPRIYPMDNPDEMRSHFSGMPGKVGKPSSRSIADGQSQHSFSNNSHRGYLGSVFPSNLVNSRPELRQSRQSLTGASERISRASYAGSIHGGPTSVASSTRRSRPRSRSRDQLNAAHLHNHRPGSRYSTAGSTHTLNNYCDTSDNWTDHDMDIYMARNPTTRNGLVPL